VKKIYTIRDVTGQRAHMWNARRIEEEVAACPGRAIARHFLEYLPKDAPILEAGCGLGAWVVYLSERGYDVSGIDNDPHVIERLKAWRPALKVGCGDIRKLPYGDNELGAVISLGVVEHFEEGCRDAMVEAHRVLRPGGLLFFTVPMNNLFRRVFAHPARALYLDWRKAKGDTVHFAEYRFSRMEVEALLRGFGFEPVLTTWDDFTEKGMSLGIWADFPPLQAAPLYAMKPAGKALAFIMNSLSRWIACAGVFSMARKTPIP
jgi:SAM-dependent methyltransferase